MFQIFVIPLFCQTQAEKEHLPVHPGTVAKLRAHIEAVIQALPDDLQGILHKPSTPWPLIPEGVGSHSHCVFNIWRFTDIFPAQSGSRSHTGPAWIPEEDASCVQKQIEKKKNAPPTAFDPTLTLWTKKEVWPSDLQDCGFFWTTHNGAKKEVFVTLTIFQLFFCGLAEICLRLHRIGADCGKEKACRAELWPPADPDSFSPHFLFHYPEHVVLQTEVTVESFY